MFNFQKEAVKNFDSKNRSNTTVYGSLVYTLIDAHVRRCLGFSSARLTASVKLDNGGLVILVFLLVTNPSSPKRDFAFFGTCPIVTLYFCELKLNECPPTTKIISTERFSNLLLNKCNPTARRCNNLNDFEILKSKP